MMNLMTNKVLIAFVVIAIATLLGGCTQPDHAYQVLVREGYKTFKFMATAFLDVGKKILSEPSSLLLKMATR